MQKDVKLGLGVGLVLLVLCGFFYIKMRSTERQPAEPTDTGIEKILSTDQAKGTKSSLDAELPKEVAPPVETEVSVKEQPSLEVEMPPAVDATKQEEPKEPNTIVKIGPSRETVGEKVEKIEKEKAEDKAAEKPDFPVIPTDVAKPPATPGVARGGGEYVVEPGDTLSGIASEVLGSAKHWKALYEANRDKLSSPEKLMVGMKLVLPEITAEPKEEKPAPAPEPTLVPPKAPEPAEQGDVHVVQKGETLSDIAEFYLNDRAKWKTIAKANPEVDPNRLKIGQKIKIPQP